MDLIYTDAYGQDVGVLKDYTFDLAFGSDENDFELTMDLSQHCCEPNCLLYIENTEYGGIIDKINVETKDDQLIYGGRTWHGILASKVIEPMTVSGEANAVIGELLELLSLTNLFTVSENDSRMYIDNYSFNRHVDGYTGICKMLMTVSGKLKFVFVEDRVILSAEPIVDYSKDEQFDNDNVEMVIEKLYNSVNHLICIGKEDAEVDLPVVHLYKGENGIFTSGAKVFTGIREVVAIYEYSKESDLEILLESLAMGDTKYVKGTIGEDKIQMNFTSEDTVYDVGDIVGAKEIITGTVATAKITKKIVKISQNEIDIQYKVGE